LRKIRSFLKNNSNLYRVLELRFGGIMRKYYSPKDNLHLKEQAWKVTFNALRRFDEELSRIKQKCLLLWIPYPQTITSQNNSIALRVKKQGYNNIIFVNLLQKMRENPMYYYYKLNSHWNKNGHELAAKVLLEHIKKFNLINFDKNS
ncbi:MAG: hypothetical protein O7F74_08930, partial [Bacteroidetes bacterium]|nr:hypothetical protein [Bacteroidota bacterium]